MDAHTTAPPHRDRLRRFALFWLAGIAVILVTITTTALLNQFGYFILAMTCACLSALTLFPLGIHFAGSGKRDSDWGVFFTVTFCGVVIAFAAALAGQDDVVLYGKSARDVVAARAPATGAAFFHFRDARVLADRIIRIPVYAKTMKEKSHIEYHAAFAPIVDRNWTPDQPVAAFAFIGSPTLGHHTAEWRQPWNAGILANAVNAHEWEIARGNFSVHDGITVAQGAIVVRWSPDPEGQAAAARGRLLNTALIVTVIWSLTTIIGLVVTVRGRSKRPGLHRP